MYETYVNQWGQWINLNWEYSRKKCEEYIETRLRNIFKYRVKAGDTVELRDGRIGKVQYIKYLGDSTTKINGLGADVWCIEVIVGSKVIIVDSIWDMTIVEPQEVYHHASS